MGSTTLLSIIQERGARGLPLQQVYRMLYNRNLYLTAYGNLYRNQGAMTKGTTDETVDGMSLEKIERMIAMVRAERYRWKPVRRVSIPKPNGKTRPLGLPPWSDKLLQEAVIPGKPPSPVITVSSVLAFRKHRCENTPVT